MKEVSKPVKQCAWGQYGRKACEDIWEYKLNICLTDEHS